MRMKKKKSTTQIHFGPWPASPLPPTRVNLSNNWLPGYIFDKSSILVPVKTKNLVGLQFQKMVTKISQTRSLMCYDISIFFEKISQTLWCAPTFQKWWRKSRWHFRIRNVVAHLRELSDALRHFNFFISASGGLAGRPDTTVTYVFPIPFPVPTTLNSGYKLFPVPVPSGVWATPNTEFLCIPLRIAIPIWKEGTCGSDWKM